MLSEYKIDIGCHELLAPNNIANTVDYMQVSLMHAWVIHSHMRLLEQVLINGLYY